MAKTKTALSILGPAASDKWDMIIGPQRRVFDLRLRELWHSRDLIGLFVRRDFVSVYKQTILGPLWYLIQPLLTTIVFTVVFGNIAKLPTDGLPSFLFYMAGTVIFTYFASCLTKTSETFVTNSNLFGKVYFPRLSVPVSILISNLIAFAIQFALFLVFMGYFAIKGTLLHPNWWVLLTPVLLLMMAGLGLGFGIIVSSMTTKYRDLRFLVQFGVTLLQYVTPIIYPLSSMSPKYQALMRLNPLTSIVEAFRYAYLGSGSVNFLQLAYSFGVMVIAIIAGVLLFNQVEATFMDTV
ncbi:MAG TPA: ABC transporter permease [Anaerolineales bacterium]|nr:ABC transporter permease [Anaerolineales bacterium]